MVAEDLVQEVSESLYSAAPLRAFPATLAALEEWRAKAEGGK